ncbi:MAG: MFS transporter [Burkholderiales bacterium]|nr:MFS transporter [Burkholderiales bacterium]
MYDFANSGYTTVVITAIFNAYFVGVIAGGAHWATFAWTAALSVSYLLIMLCGPLVGAYADAHAAKKRLLLGTTVGCVLGTALLALAGPGQLWLACVLIILSNFFFGLGENIVAAFLPEIAQGEAIGKVSAWGWALGYLGGIVSLGACLAYVTWAQGRGQSAGEFVPATMLITAALFAVASLPTFLFLRERAQPQPMAPGLYTRAFTRVADTLQHARRYADLRRFLSCIVLYQSGVSAVITLAAIYAEQVMRFTTQDTLLLILVVNVTASLGALAFGHLQDRIGHVPTIALTLLGWCAMVILAWQSTSAASFWVAANLAGLCLGASQSAGRAVVGYLSPARRRAEFFGLWGFAVKLASILGPITYGVVTWISGSDHRLAMLITGVFFVAGLAVLLSVDVARGRAAALAAEAK